MSNMRLIHFKTEMIEAIEKGDKTQTTRPVKRKKDSKFPACEEPFSVGEILQTVNTDDKSLGPKIRIEALCPCRYDEVEACHYTNEGFDYCGDPENHGKWDYLYFRDFWNECYKDQPEYQSKENPMVWVYQFTKLSVEPKEGQ